jgi:hypothetical protein
MLNLCQCPEYLVAGVAATGSCQSMGVRLGAKGTPVTTVVLRRWMVVAGMDQITTVVWYYGKDGLTQFTWLPLSWVHNKCLRYYCPKRKQWTLQHKQSTWRVEEAKQDSAFCSPI